LLVPLTAAGEVMSPQFEEDFPKGHPGRADYDPHSADAIEWARRNVAPLGERDFPVDHIKAADTPGNTNHLTWLPGVDPHNPHREPFTGRTPEQAAGVAALSAIASKAAKESPVTQPLDAVAVNEALDKKRAEVGRDLLTPEEYREVIGALQSAPRAVESDEAIKARIEKQHLALGKLIGQGYTRDAAMQIIAHDGPDKVLGVSANAAG
jgi:hypothetical protein